MKDFTYKHIIWDWNGTLFDDAWLCIEVMSDQLTQRGLPALTASSYEDLFGFPVRDYYQTLGFDFSQEPFEKLSDEFIESYNARLFECDLRLDALETLSRLSETGISQSILSAMKQDALDMMIKHFGLGEYFVDVVGLDDHHAFGKTEKGKQWIAKSGIDPTGIVFIGDTDHDYEVARAIGVDCLHVYSGHQSVKRLETNGVRIARHLNELFEG